jgi:putative tricarboxylic transport membrane protein
MMKKIFLVLFIVLSVIAGSIGAVNAEFPRKPIKLMVYTKPGGAIDVFARKFEAIAKKYTDATFVVMNKTGAGGVVAMKDVLASKADGYKFMAVTRSNVGKIVSTGGSVDVNELSWLAMMVSDPEAIITNRNLPVKTWADIVADAKAKQGKQLWVGPATGGNDHIMAMKTWKAAGIKAKWVPYASGGKAMAALLGGHGVVYVGNPQDVIGRPDLMVAVISSEGRLSGNFSDVPTFREQGISGLDNEIMWRGFMVKKGTPKEAVTFYYDLLSKGANDPEWRKYISKGGANPVFKKEAEFTEIVKKDKEVFTATLKDLGVIK